jgi:hypothetical protein
MTKAFKAEDGSHSTVALIDGYSIGDRLLEGCMFECHIVNDEIVVNVSPPFAKYFSGLNTKKWLTAITESVNDPNFDSFISLDKKQDVWLTEI